MFKRLLVLAAVLLVSGVTFAVPIAPQIVEMLKQSGQLDQIVQADKVARDKGVWAPNPDPLRFGLTTDIDTVYCLIILVDFDDLPYTQGYVGTSDKIDSVLFSVDVYEPGSMTDYYFETSYGQAHLMGQVTQWYRMPNGYTYYSDGQRGFGQYPRNAQRLTEDAVTAADPDVDFSLYDNDGDGQVDGLFVVHSGPGYEDTGNLNYIHSHAWVTSYSMQTDDGVYVRRYSMEPEETGGGQLIHPGVFCHEFGHVLGLPDLYDTDYSSDGTGMWSIMSGGSWGDGGRRPVHFDAWCKIQLGWISPQDPDVNLDNEQIDAVEYSPDVYRLFSGGDSFAQYFVVENRQPYGFDLSLPGTGLLIYHIDETVNNNDNENRYHVAVEQADGDYDLEHADGSDPGDPWPGSSNNRTFDDFSVPDAHFYVYGPSMISVNDISDSDSTMHANLYIYYNSPLYQILNLSYDDSPNGNSNGRPEAGETCNLLFQAQNIRISADNLVVTASCSDDNIIFGDNTSSFGQVPVNIPFDNDNDVITFTVPEDYPTSAVTLTLDFSSNNGADHQQFERTMVIGTPDLLLVDDDAGDTLEAFYMSAFDSLGLVYETWDVAAQGDVGDILNGYPMVVWFTGDTRQEATSSDNVESLVNYLDAGGHLLVTSQDFVQSLADRDEANDILLLNNYLKVDYQTRESSHIVEGETGGFFDGRQFLTGGNGGAYNQISQDALTMLDGGTQQLSYSSGTIAGVGVLTSGYAALTIGFGIEGISNNYPDYDHREDILAAAREYLFSFTSIDDNEAFLPASLSLSQNYPNPFNARTIISYSLTEQTDVRIDIYDILGRLVTTLVNTNQQAGKYQAQWDASGESSGVYFYRITAGDKTETRQMILLK